MANHSIILMNEVAKNLTETFMKNGAFIASRSPILQAGTPVQANINPNEGIGFAGLPVQGVGKAATTDGPVVYVYTTKRPGKAARLVPDTIQDVAIRIRRLSKLIIDPEQSVTATGRGEMYTRNERVACGSSCAPGQQNYAGTLGALVERKGEVYALSNNHVFSACNHVPLDMPILSPSWIDVSSGGAQPRTICNHSEFQELRSGEPNLVPPCKEDVALALVKDKSLVTSWQGDSRFGYDTPTNIVSPEPGMKVKKFGRTTGLTYGTIESEWDLFPMPYKSKEFSATVWMEGAWIIQGDGRDLDDNFALPGDSGSLIVTEDGKKAVGLLFAVSGPNGLMFPMSHISTLFGGFRLIDNHGI